EAGMALASELSLDNLLQRLTAVAADLTGARYAALGVIDPTGSHLERFITYGIDDETRAAIGDPPHGRGILGALIRDARPRRRSRGRCVSGRAPAGAPRDPAPPLFVRFPPNPPADDDLPRRADPAAR